MPDPQPRQISLTDKFRLLMEWLPALQMLPIIATAAPGRDQALQVMRLLEIVSAKTTGKLDDELTSLLKDVLLTEAGGRLTDYIATKIRGAIDVAG